MDIKFTKTYEISACTESALLINCNQRDHDKKLTIHEIKTTRSAKSYLKAVNITDKQI